MSAALVSNKVAILVARAGNHVMLARPARYWKEFHIALTNSRKYCQEVFYKCLGMVVTVYQTELNTTGEF